MFKDLIRAFINRRNIIHLEYPVDNVSRYGHGLPVHKGLNSIISEYRSEYKKWLNLALAHIEELRALDDQLRDQVNLPTIWRNGYLPGVDIIMLYTMISRLQPGKYLEIGSGMSTHIARQAIRNQGSDTEVVIIDPSPRKAIDGVADTVINQPLEQVDPGIFQSLKSGDVLFMDGSHRILPNSDAMVFFLDIMPRLQKGCIVHIHDVYWPHDYPQFMCDRYYSEQYGLAISLLSNPDGFNILSANYFISKDPELSGLIDPIWEDEKIGTSERHGGSFWFEVIQRD